MLCILTESVFAISVKDGVSGGRTCGQVFYQGTVRDNQGRGKEPAFIEFTANRVDTNAVGVYYSQPSTHGKD